MEINRTGAEVGLTVGRVVPLQGREHIIIPMPEETKQVQQVTVKLALSEPDAALLRKVGDILGQVATRHPEEAETLSQILGLLTGVKED